MPQIGDVINGSEIGRRKEKTHDHKYIWAGCIDCGKERWVVRKWGLPRSKRCPSCYHKQNKGSKNPRWKGGRIIVDGYVYIKLQSDNFFFPMTTKDNYVAEHRLVMAEELGCNLNSWEVVHHKDKDRGNNHIENLELHSDMGHKGRHIMEAKIKYLTERITFLEAENTLLKAKIVGLDPFYLKL